MATQTAAKKNLYPSIRIDRIKNPNRFYAFFIVGGFVKILILIPVWIELLVLGIAQGILSIINSFVVLFTGKYWKPCYTLSLGLFRMNTKVSYFMAGLTNKYPGFSLDIQDDFDVNMAMPDKPNRLFAIPILGGLARIILLIPFLIYTSVIQYAAMIGAVVASFPVLFKGYYPESLYEINRDNMRVSLASSAYVAGLSDSYPNFWISMNHKTVKIILIILGTLYMLSNFFRSANQSQQRSLQYNDRMMEQTNPSNSTNPYSY